VLDKLRPGSYFINTARGEVWTTPRRARGEGRAFASRSTCSPPSRKRRRRVQRSESRAAGVYGTIHRASTDQAQEAIAAETIRIVAAYKDRQGAETRQTLRKKTPATHMLVVRHRDRPGVSRMCSPPAVGDINVQETRERDLRGRRRRRARINLDGAPSPALLAKIQDGNSDISTFTS